MFVVNPGADHRADLRARKDEMQDQHDQQSKRDDEQSVGRVGDAEKLDGAGQQFRLRDAKRDIAPDHAEKIQKHENQTKCHQCLAHRPGVAHPSDQPEI